MAESVVREGLCGRQWFLRVYVAESVVHEGLCGRVSGL